MSMCECPSVYSYRKKREREKEKLLVCVMLIFFLFFFLSFQSAMLFRLQMTFIHCLHKCECTHFQVMLGTINRKLCCVMIDDLSVCMRASERCFINTFIYIYIYTWHVWYKKIIWIMVNLHLKLTNDDEHHKEEMKKEKMSFLIQ